MGSLIIEEWLEQRPTPISKADQVVTAIESSFNLDREVLDGFRAAGNPSAER